MFWIIIGLMLAAALLFVAMPLYRAERKLSTTALASVVVMCGVAAAVYTQVGSPGLEVSRQQQQHEMPGVEEMIGALATRLEREPNDVAGWQLLGPSYMQLGKPLEAITAFEKAVELESGRDGQTLADLGEAVLMADAEALNGRASQLFENALALVPNNPKALFYSGLAAVQRGDNELGASRWEALLATSPPPDVADTLRRRIAEIRGDGTEVASNPEPVTAPVEDGALNISVALGDAAASAGLPNATVFVIVSVPEQPGPPIAAARRSLSDLPAAVTIGDGDAMIAGRVPSAFEKLEITARVSLTGQPMAQSGDWYGRAIIDTAATDSVDIVINEQVP